MKHNDNLNRLYSTASNSPNHWTFVGKEDLMRYESLKSENKHFVRQSLVRSQLTKCIEEFITINPHIVQEKREIRTDVVAHPKMVLSGDLYVYTEEQLHELIQMAYDAGMDSIRRG